MGAEAAAAAVHRTGSVVRFSRPALVDVPGAVLTDPEEGRAAALRDSANREAFVAAHLLVRQVVGELLGVPPAVVRLHQECATCGGPHGRPCVVGYPAVHATLAHTRGAVAAVAAFAPCGVDVEVIGPRAVPAAALTDAERVVVGAAPDPVRAGTELWVSKECAVKAGLATLEEFAALAAPDLGAVRLQGATATSRAGAGRWAHASVVGAWLVAG